MSTSQTEKPRSRADHREYHAELAAQRADVAAQIAAEGARAPTYDGAKWSHAAARFNQQVQTFIERLRHDKDLQLRKKGVNLRLMAARIEDLQSQRNDADARWRAANTVYETAPKGTVQYTPGARERAEEAAQHVVTIRTALTDMITDGSETAQTIRSNCGVGMPLRMDAPQEVQDTALRQLFTLKNAENAQWLKARGFEVDAFVLPLEEASEALRRELEKVPLVTSGSARERRDVTQVEIEILSARIQGLLLAAIDIQARDAVRDTLPRSTFGQRRSDRGKNPSPDQPADGGTPLAATSGGKDVLPRPPSGAPEVPTAVPSTPPAAPATPATPR